MCLIMKTRFLFPLKNGKDVPESTDIVNTRSRKAISVRKVVSGDLLSKDEVNRKIYHAVLDKGSHESLNDEESEFREWVKIEAFQKIERLDRIEEMQERIRERERADGYFFCFFKMGGILNNDESDLIVGSAIRHHELPGGHPLQNARVWTYLPRFAWKSNPALKGKM